MLVGYVLLFTQKKKNQVSMITEKKVSMLKNRGAALVRVVFPLVEKSSALCTRCKNNNLNIL
jgi:hypothetical protein